jgi:hypothetical protein
LRQDHTDFLEAMAWFAGLDDRKLSARSQAWSLSRPQCVLLWRSLTVPLSFADIGAEFGSMTRQGAKYLYDKTIDRIAAIANRPAAVAPVIMEVRERNRAHRMAG